MSTMLFESCIVRAWLWHLFRDTNIKVLGDLETKLEGHFWGSADIGSWRASLLPSALDSYPIIEAFPLGPPIAWPTPSNPTQPEQHPRLG